MARVLGKRYGYSPEAAARSSRRVRQILRLLLGAARGPGPQGSQYLVGQQISAVDVYWATFAAMLKPMPDDLCPMPAPMRASYAALPPEVAAELDPALLEHRDRIYAKHLKLPVEF